MLIDYLNLPEIPKKLILPNDLILQQHLIDSKDNLGQIFYQTYAVNAELDQWLNEHIPYKVGYGMYQLIYSSLPVHRDFGADQMTTAINYIIDAGGTNVITSMYDDDYNSIQDICICQERWHKLAVNHLHGVQNVSSLRVMVRLFTHHGFKDII